MDGRLLQRDSCNAIDNVVFEMTEFPSLKPPVWQNLWSGIYATRLPAAPITLAAIKSSRLPGL